jgi:tetratricopeptide (TPR) repeat protein
MKKPDCTSSEYREMLQHLLSSGLFEARRRNIPVAAKILQRISCLQLRYASDFRQAGNLASLIGQHENAIRLIQTATEMVPDSHEVWAELGDAYCNGGNMEQAIKAYENSLDINPNAILIGLAQAYDLIGKHDRADNELERIIKHRFDNTPDGDNHSKRPALLFALLPKSAGTSLSHAIEQCTGIAHGNAVATTDRDYFPNSRISRKAFCAAIRYPVRLHTHIRATDSNLEILNKSGIAQVLVHVRDPRQAFVSYYFHSKNGMGLVRNRYANRSFDSLDDQGKFRWFMEFYYPKFINWIMEWVQVENNISRYSFSLKITTFEDMLKTGQVSLVKDICDFYGISPKYSIVEQKHRFRKGAVDEWRSVIPDTYHATLSQMIPPVLIERFGWKP